LAKITQQGQLGLGEKIESEAAYRMQPKQVEFFLGKKVLAAKCGGEHTLALVEN